jgi:trk system potassium uptake protein TrkA
MFIVIGGAGMVGGGLAEQLALNKHDVVVIDSKKEVCQDLTARTGVVAVFGSATDADVLEQAGIKKADVAVGAMRLDGDNLAFTLLARRYGVTRIYTRIRKRSNQPAFDLAGVTKTLAITDIFLNRMILEIERPNLQHVATFGEGQANIVILRVLEGALAADKTVAELTQMKDFPSDCVIAGIFREVTGDFIFPRGNQKFRDDDQVFVAAGVEAVRKAAEFFTQQA